MPPRTAGSFRRPWSPRRCQPTPSAIRVEVQAVLGEAGELLHRVRPSRRAGQQRSDLGAAHSVEQRGADVHADAVSVGSGQQRGAGQRVRVGDCSIGPDGGREDHDVRDELPAERAQVETFPVREISMDPLRRDHGACGSANRERGRGDPRRRRILRVRERFRGMRPEREQRCDERVHRAPTYPRSGTAR